MVQGLSDAERVMWLYLTTGPQSTSVGIYRLSIAVAVEELGNLTETEFLERLEAVCDVFAWRYDPRTRVLWLPEWLRENPPQSPNVCVAWRKLLVTVPDCELKAEAIDAIQGFLCSFGESFRKAFGNLQVRLPQGFSKVSPIQRSEIRDQRSGSSSERSTYVNDIPAAATEAAKEASRYVEKNTADDVLVDTFQNVYRARTPTHDLPRDVALAAMKRELESEPGRSNGRFEKAAG
jgi:hypothetical protein